MIELIPFLCILLAFALGMIAVLMKQVGDLFSCCVEMANAGLATAEYANHLSERISKLEGKQ